MKEKVEEKKCVCNLTNKLVSLVEKKWKYLLHLLFIERIGKQTIDIISLTIENIFFYRRYFNKTIHLTHCFYFHTFAQ